MARKPLLNVSLSAQADKDMRDVWAWNAEQRGEPHADGYVAFLYAEMQKIGLDPVAGRRVKSRSDLFRLTMRRRPGGHGHIAFYTVEVETIAIVRILHSARDWPNLLGDP